MSALREVRASDSEEEDEEDEDFQPEKQSDEEEGGEDQPVDEEEEEEEISGMERIGKRKRVEKRDNSITAKRLRGGRKGGLQVSDDDGGGGDNKRMETPGKEQEKKEEEEEVKKMELLQKKEEEQQRRKKEEEEEAAARKKKMEEEKKKKMDALWAEMNLDNTTSTTSASPSKTSSAATPTILAPKATIEVKEKYDFAGETVVVTKKVSEEEHKKLQKEQQAKASKPKGAPNLGNLLASFKPKKMSTLTKTALDWEQYKDKEGIDKEELKQKAQHGYLDKQAFLQRTDYRQFEKEKEIRAAQKRKQQS